MVSPGKKKKSTRATGETSNSSYPTVEAPPQVVKISESQRAVSEPGLVAPSTGDEERGNLPVDVKVGPDANPTLRSRNRGVALFQALRGLNDIHRNVVREMRVKYCTAILDSDINIHRDQVLAASKEYYETKLKDELVGVDELLSAYE
ncbi:hypothetical protein CASFOL_011255 [Castilleja foliolosa]|uniref:Uncharacterized protein n=1 Tax=Castilleja foliolosa TaxID=1961234 RepID=A0ABD3DYY9_9LAMI